MNLTGSNHLWWWMAVLIWVGVIVGVIGIIAYYLPSSALYGIAFWLLSIGFLLLAVACAIIYLRKI